MPSKRRAPGRFCTPAHIGLTPPLPPSPPTHAHTPVRVPAGYAHKGADGKLHFSGLVATPDGKQIMRTTRVANFSAEDAAKAGADAGKELKATGPKELFMY